MFTEIVSNNIDGRHVYRDCVKYLQLGVMFTEIVSNNIDGCHVYRDCVKYLQLGVMFTEIVSNIYSLVSCLQRLCQIL